VIVLFVPPVTATADEVAASIRDVLEPGEKPVLAVVMSAEGIPPALRSEPQAAAAFIYPESAARALGRAAERAEWLRRPLGLLPELSVDRDAATTVIEPALTDPDGAWLDPAKTRELLLSYGIPLVREALAHSAEEAVAAAEASATPSSSRPPRPGRTRRNAAASPSTSATAPPCALPLR
jgi:acyl-CoA synthetase (NDP forming)